MPSLGADDFPRGFVSRLAALQARADDLGGPSEEAMRECLLRASGDVGDAASLLLAMKSHTSLCSKEDCAEFLGSLPHLGSVGTFKAWEVLEAAGWDPLKAEKTLECGVEASSVSSSSAVPEIRCEAWSKVQEETEHTSTSVAAIRLPSNPTRTNLMRKAPSLEEENANHLPTQTPPDSSETDSTHASSRLTSRPVSDVRKPKEFTCEEDRQDAAHLRERIAFLEGENARLTEQASVANEIRSLVRVNQILVERIQKLEEENTRLRDSATSTPTTRTVIPPAPAEGARVAPASARPYPLAQNPAIGSENPADVHARMEGLSQRWHNFRAQLITPRSLSLTRSNSVSSLHGPAASPGATLTLPSSAGWPRPAIGALAHSVSSASIKLAGSKTPSPTMPATYLTFQPSCKLTPKQRTRGLLQNPPPLVTKAPST